MVTSLSSEVAIALVYRALEEGFGRREGEEASSHQVCPLYMYVSYPIVSSDPLTGSGNISRGVGGKWK